MEPSNTSVCLCFLLVTVSVRTLRDLFSDGACAHVLQLVGAGELQAVADTRDRFLMRKVWTAVHEPTAIWSYGICLNGQCVLL
jgi:hypothetical protein